MGCFFHFLEVPSDLNLVRNSAPVHILAAERVKLACKRQGERIFAKGEYLGGGIPMGCFFHFLEVPSDLNLVRNSAPVHILAAERVKLACKRQGERIFAKGQIEWCFSPDLDEKSYTMCLLNLFLIRNSYKIICAYFIKLTELY